MNPSHDIIRSLLQLGSFLQKRGNRITEPFGVNQQQFVLLAEIVEKKEVNQTQIVSELLFEKSNVSKMVKKLSRIEFISVSKSPHDRRTTLLAPTPKGIAAYAACMAELKQWNRDCFKNLDPGEADAILSVLNKLKTRILQ